MINVQPGNDSHLLQEGNLSRISWESLPKSYGNRFPNSWRTFPSVYFSEEIIFSKGLGNDSKYNSGNDSHEVWERFPSRRRWKLLPEYYENANMIAAIVLQSSLGLRRMSFCQKNGIIPLYHLLTIQKENGARWRGDISSFAGLVLFFGRLLSKATAGTWNFWSTHITQVPKIGPSPITVLKSSIVYTTNYVPFKTSSMHCC